MQPIKFELIPSWYLTLIFLLLHSGAIAIVLWIVPLNVFKISLLVLCCGSLFYALRSLFNATAILRFWLESDHSWSLQQRNGQIFVATLCGDSLCTEYFVLLNFKRDSKKFRRSIMILPDAMTSDDFRQLRISLLTMRSFHAAHS